MADAADTGHAPQKGALQQRVAIDRCIEHAIRDLEALKQQGFFTKAAEESRHAGTDLQEAVEAAQHNVEATVEQAQAEMDVEGLVTLAGAHAKEAGEDMYARAQAAFDVYTRHVEQSRDHLRSTSETLRAHVRATGDRLAAMAQRLSDELEGAAVTLASDIAAAHEIADAAKGMTPVLHAGAEAEAAGHEIYLRAVDAQEEVDASLAGARARTDATKQQASKLFDDAKKRAESAAHEVKVLADAADRSFDARIAAGIAEVETLGQAADVLEAGDVVEDAVRSFQECRSHGESKESELEQDVMNGQAPADHGDASESHAA